MGTSKDWARFNSLNRVRGGRDRADTGPKLRDVFEALEYYVKDQEELASNWVVVPSDWRSMSDDKLFKFRTFHSRKKCAEELPNFKRSGGDLMARVSDDVIEMLNIRSCKKCGLNNN